MPLTQSLATAFTMCIFAFAPFAHLNILLTGSSFAREGGFVDFKRYRRDETDVGWYTVSYREGDEISWKEGVG
jgi:hypothetical protein